jgi:hypothetical protein
MPWAVRGVERFIAFDYTRVRANHAILAELATHNDVTIFSSHDPVEYERLRAASGRRTLWPQQHATDEFAPRQFGPK